MSQLFDDAPQDTTTGATDGGAEKAATTTGGQEEGTLLGDEGNRPTAAKADQGGEDPKGGEPTKKEGAEKAAPPEYADFVFPEGMQVNEHLMGEFKGLAKEMGLPQEAAQKLIDLQIKNTQAQMEAFQAVRAEWRAEFPKGAADPVVQDAAYVLKRFDTDGALARELELSGQGDNPKVIRFLANIRKEFKEDAVHAGGDAKKDDRPLRERLWPDNTMPK